MQRRVVDKSQARRARQAFCGALIGALALLLAAWAIGQVSSAGATSAQPPLPSGQSSGAVPAENGTYGQEGFETNCLPTGTCVYVSSAVTVSPTPLAPVEWDQVSDSVHSGTKAAHAADTDGISDLRLTLAAPIDVPANATGASFTFWHHFDFEQTSVDGGVLETSTDRGSTWQDVLSTTTFLAGGYNGQILSAAATNPLHGRAAWVNNVASYTQSTVNLLPFAGHRVQLRLRMGTDLNNEGTPGGWWVDDISVQLSAPCGLSTLSSIADYPVGGLLYGGMASQGNMLYNFGGYNEFTSQLVAYSYKYNLASNTWTSIADLPLATDEASVVSDGAYVYIIGGRTTSGLTGQVERYNPATNTYTALTSQPVPTTASSAVYLNGKIYVIGGGSGNTGFTLIPTVQLFNVSTNSWSTVADYPEVIEAETSTVFGNTILVAGGTTAPSSAPSTRVERYDVATNQWNNTQLPILPERRQFAVSGIVGNYWVIAGHQPGTIGLNLTTLTWSTLPSLSIDTTDDGAIANGALYVVSDLSNFMPVNKYTEDACVTPSPTPGHNTSTPTSVPGSPTASPTACTIQFTDVPVGSTFYSYIHCLACLGIINGYSDGTFKPNANVTRGQLSKIVSNAAGFTGDDATQMFQDVSVGSTFQLFINRLASRGFIGGYPCGGPGEPCVAPGNLPYFRPNANATRGQISKIDSNAAGFADNPQGRQFEDVAQGSAFYTFTYRLVSRTIMGGYACGNAPAGPCVAPDNLPYFVPNNNATRGQTSKIVAGTFFPDCQIP